MTATASSGAFHASGRKRKLRREQGDRFLSYGSNLHHHPYFLLSFANGSTKKCREFSSVNYIADEISNEESQTDTLAIEQSINAYRFGSHTESAASDAENPGRTPNRDKFPRSLTKLPANLFAGIEIFLNIAYRSCIRRTPTGPYLFSKYEEIFLYY